MPFLAFGALFGLATYSIRHLFTEGGTTRSDNGERGPMDGRTMWVAMSVFLWPIFMLTGLYSMIRRSRVRVRAERQQGSDGNG